MKRAASDFGWLLGVLGFFVAVATLVLYSQASHQTPPGITGPRAFSPGSSFNVEEWCKQKASRVIVNFNPDASGVSFTAARGAEEVSWTPNATGDGEHRWNDPKKATADNPTGQQVEHVLVTESARECMTTPK